MALKPPGTAGDPAPGSGLLLSSIPAPWFLLVGQVVLLLFLVGIARTSDGWGTVGIIFLVALWIGFLLTHAGGVGQVFQTLATGQL